MQFWRTHEPAQLSGNKGCSNRSPCPAEGFQDSPVGKHCRRKREKSVRCGLNLLQCLFGKLLIDKSLLIFLSLTLVLVLAACHPHPVSSQQCPVGLSLRAAGQAKGLTAPLPTTPTQEQAVGQCLPHPGHPTWIWMRGQVCWSFCPGPCVHPCGSSCMSLLSAG